MDEAFITKYNLDISSEMRTVQHTDFQTDACGKMTKGDSGFLSGLAPVAKVGVMKYFMADGKVIREFVPEETLFNKDSMASLKMKPMTNNHPPERKVDSKNAAYRQVGYTGETVVRDDEKLLCSMVITDQEAIDSGRNQLSPGYETRLLFQRGVYNGDEYDAIQTSRKYNHVALVDVARGGSDICMNVDGMEINEFVQIDSLNSNKETRMVKYNIDGIDYEASPEVVNLLNKKVEELKVANDAAQTATAERDALAVKVDALEKRDIKGEVQAAVKQRIELERVAGTVLEKTDGIEALSDRELKLKILGTKYEKLVTKIDDKTSEVYIDALLDTLKVDATQEDGLAGQRAAVTPKVEGEVKNDSETARDRMIKRQTEAHKTK